MVLGPSLLVCQALSYKNYLNILQGYRLIKLAQLVHQISFRIKFLFHIIGHVISHFFWDGNQMPSRVIPQTTYAKNASTHL